MLRGFTLHFICRLEEHTVRNHKDKDGSRAAQDTAVARTVSAMLVAKTILRTPAWGRLKTLRCSAAGTMLCRGRTMYLLPLRALCLPSSCSFRRMISSHPAHSDKHPH